MFEAYFGKRWRATPLGMSGDTVAYLRWRLEHGELPRARPPRVAVLLVGTNDLRDAKALYEHQAGDGATVAGRAAAVLASARDIGSRCGLHAQTYAMHKGAVCKRLNSLERHRSRKSDAFGILRSCTPSLQACCQHVSGHQAGGSA